MLKIVSLVVGSWLLAACGSGSSGAAGGELNGDSVKPYTLTCTQSSCDSCRDDAEARYAECSSLCRSAFAPAGCFSQCPSIGDSSCPYDCGANERCDEWKANLPVPERDEDAYQACLAFNAACVDVEQKFIDAQCNYEARLMQPKHGAQFECALERGCDKASECFVVPAPGTLGSETCRRSAACGVPCRAAEAGFSSDEDYLNGVEGSLRPSLVALARRCVTEPTCAEFKACNESLEYLWQLAWHQYSGT
jgi:hypothetical protein